MTQTVDVSRLPTYLRLGRQTETGVTDIAIDCANWLALWPDLALTIWVVPPGGEAGYPAACEMDGARLVWHVSAADTQTAGTGTAEIRGEADGRRKLSATVRTMITPTSVPTEDEPPEEIASWYDRVLAASEAAREAAESAASKEALEQQGETIAQQSETIAQQGEAIAQQGKTIAQQQTAIEGKQSAGDYALRSEIPTVPVQSVNGKTGAVQLSAADVRAQPEGDYALKSEIPTVPVQSVNGKTGAVQLSAADVRAQPEGDYVTYKIVPFEDGAQITLADDTEYYAETITALTLALPTEIPAGFRACLDFGCGETAAALVYPDTLIWSGDSRDDNGLFVPLAEHRYHVDIWYDGAVIRANASGVIA